MTLAALLIPLATALVVAFIPTSPLKHAFTIIGTLATFVVALFLGSSPAVETLWIPGFEVYFSLSPAGASGLLVLVASLVMIPAAVYASLTVERHMGAFVALLLLMQAGLNGVFLAKDLVLFYVFWEATLIPSVLMLGIWGGPGRRQAAIKYLMYAVTGSFLMLVAILAIRPLSGAVSYRLDDLLAVTPALPFPTQLWLFIAFTLAFAVKLPLWPLHAWLPDFHEQNHPSGSADMAGTLYKVGGWGFFAWALPLLPNAAAAAAPYLLAFAAVTALYAAIIATSQTHVKRLLAYASLSHMGIVGVGVFGLHIAGLNGAVYPLGGADGLDGRALFCSAGCSTRVVGTFDMTRYGGLAKSAPMLAALTLCSCCSPLSACLGLANFPGEFMSLMGAYQDECPWLGSRRQRSR